MKTKLGCLILLLLLILLILWLLGGGQGGPDPDPDPQPTECVGTRTFTRTPALFIPEASPPGPGTPNPVTDTMTISETGTISDLDVRFTSHLPEFGELILELTSPANTKITFLSTEGGPGDGWENVTFDDEAAGPPPSFNVNGTCLTNQSYQPGPGDFSAFDGESINGTWTLTVSDAFVGDAVDCDCDGFVVGPACPRLLEEWSLVVECGPEQAVSR